ncbi:7684_t:CDS:1 [Paraglomus brasilianum]|uniref:7684_t:CDS:1 n=1 Tax=Paraglomus brasilianum TaxID=144538 RepID=A0A9N9AHX6_9GLOM|nr:7684_t:CDS:1 [Paraglomus brasilianum]
MREQELEKKLCTALKSKTEVNDLNEKLQNKYSKQVKDFDRERKGWNRERKQWESVFDNVNGEKQKLHTHTLELINVTNTKRLKIENADLTSKNIRKDLSITESNAENAIKSKKIRSLESMIKILESKLASAQNDVFSIQKDLSKKESEIISLKSKIVELEQELASTVSELGRLKLEDISRSVIGGNIEKKKNMQSEEQSSISDSSNISAVSDSNKSLSKYFICRKNMDQDEKIDNNIPAHTNDEITELPKIDAEINPKISDVTSISETSKDIFPAQEIEIIPCTTGKSYQG